MNMDYPCIFLLDYALTHAMDYHKKSIHCVYSLLPCLRELVNCMVQTQDKQSHIFLNILNKNQLGRRRIQLLSLKNSFKLSGQSSSYRWIHQKCLLKGMNTDGGKKKLAWFYDYYTMRVSIWRPGIDGVSEYATAGVPITSGTSIFMTIKTIWHWNK